MRIVLAGGSNRGIDRTWRGVLLGARKLRTIEMNAELRVEP